MEVAVSFTSVATRFKASEAFLATERRLAGRRAFFEAFLAPPLRALLRFADDFFELFREDFFEDFFVDFLAALFFAGRREALRAELFRPAFFDDFLAEGRDFFFEPELFLLASMLILLFQSAVGEP